MPPKKNNALEQENAELASTLEDARDALEETLEQIDEVLGIEDDGQEEE